MRVSHIVLLLFLSCITSASSSERLSAGIAIPGIETGVTPDDITLPLPEDLSRFKQPAPLVEDLQRLQTGSLDVRLKALADKSLRDQVFVEGGAFLMGDFGRLHSEEQLPWDGDANSSPPHTVTLDSYSIGRYKVTLAEFDLYAEANDVASVQTEDVYTMEVANWAPWRTSDKPAGVTWKQADAYCRWLGELTDQPFALPTEAQWEYAARSRGRWVVYPTDNGKLEWNRNVPSNRLVEKVNGGGGGMPYAVGFFPPNPLGLYDLTINSLDWVQDWYAADWYTQNNNARNPKGPESGTEKVQRSWPVSNSRAAMTMTRRFENPEQEAGTTEFSGFRCALHSPRPAHS